ncbi:MAG: beta-ketoacyl-[acyl-carrier-protein] synthase family protein [Tannerellaceae bacterium]|nr:beta-ketoacyl-[acyl-carrier-protein] synthase family protein [Tannerellaceae bacterium]
MRNIYVTGMGIISALGTGYTRSLDALRKRKSGIARIKKLETLHRDFPVGEVGPSDQDMMFKLGLRKSSVTTRSALMASIAVQEALRMAEISDEYDSDRRLALISGTTVGGMDMSERYYRNFLDGPEHSAYISTHDCGSCTELTADYFGIFSFVQTISTACSSAANAILSGAELILDDRADYVVAGGSECLTKFHLNGFASLMILDREPCKPFDAARGGLNLGEGAAYIVLEAEDTIKRRNAQPICRLSGWANTCDAYHQTASSPLGDGARMSMEKALSKAGLSPADIGYINAHGTGTANNDLSEGLAIEAVFGQNIPAVSSTKAFTGHATSAAGSIEAIISIMALQHRFIPANLNFKNQMPELSFQPSQGAEGVELRHVLTNSFGFGGNDTTLIFSKNSL